MNPFRFLVPLGLAAMLVAANDRPLTAPQQEPFQGIRDRRISVAGGRPFGFGISSRGQGLVLQLDTITAAYLSIDASEVSGSVAVGNNPIDVAFSARGDRAYVTLLSGDRIMIVDVAGRRVIDSMMIGTSHHRILMHPDGSRLFVTSLDGDVWSIDLATRKVTATAQLGVPVRGIAWISSGRVTASAGSRDVQPVASTLAVTAEEELILLDGSTLAVIDREVLPGMGQEVAASHDGKQLFVAIEGRNGRVFVHDARSLDLVAAVPFTDERIAAFGMRLSPGGSLLVVTSSASGQIVIVRTDTREVVRTLNVGGAPRRVAFSPNGRAAYITNEGGWVDVLR